jgi:bleomycin hydrolase
MIKYIITLVISFLLCVAAVSGQDNSYRFTIKKEVASTPVKNQSLTSTCWSFSGLSFFESELIRMGQKPVNLSEMYTVREAYSRKAEEYARRDGGCVFGGGGEYSDLLSISKEEGLIPDSVYTGLNYGAKIHDHDEMDAALKGYMDGLLKSSKLSPAWLPGLNGILDAYLGQVPQTFEYKGKIYTAKTFTDELGLNFDDYVIFSSFEDKPLYKESILNVPNHWAPGTYYNLPLEEMMQVIDNAIMGGYSVAWASDMKGRGFSMKYGVALVPEKDWDDINDDEFRDIFTSPHPQKVITKNLREKEFENHEVNGDHGMHIIGIAEDQTGHIFYKVKNSWGATGKFGGYIYVSREYVMLKTTNCMVNKNAIPASIALKMGIETRDWKGGAVAEGENKGGSGSPTMSDNQNVLMEK